MSETRRQSAPMPFLDFIHNVQNDPQLLRVNLPEIFESPYDTSRPVDLLTPPFQESRDIREATEPDFQGWQPGERIRGTFNLGVANVARPGLPHPYLEVTASASYLATEDPSGRWDREQHALPTRFAINGGGELHPKAVATIARLGRLQIIADLVKTDANNARIAYVHAMQRPYSGNPATAYRDRHQSTIVEGVISRFHLDKTRQSEDLAPADQQGSWFEIFIQDPETGKVHPERIAWDSERHYYYSSTWETGYAAYPVALPEAGDKVQAVCRLDYAASPMLRSKVSGMHLLEPAEAQVDRTLQIEIDFNKLEQLRNASPVEYRAHLGRIIDTYQEYTGEAIRNQLSPRYLRMLNHAITAYNQQSSDRDQPGEMFIGWAINRHDAAFISKLYDIKLLATSRQELGDYAKDIVIAERRPGSQVRQGYGKQFFNLVKAMNEPAAEDAARLAINHLYDITAALPEDSYAFFHRHNSELLAAALAYVPDMQRPQGLAADLLRLGSKIFSPEAVPHPLRNDLRLPIVNALCHELQRCMMWTSQEKEPSTAISVSDPRTLDGLASQLPLMLEDIRRYYRTLQPEPPEAQKKLQYMRALLEAAKTLPHTDGLLL